MDLESSTAIIRRHAWINIIIYVSHSPLIFTIIQQPLLMIHQLANFFTVLHRSMLYTSTVELHDYPSFEGIFLWTYNDIMIYPSIQHTLIPYMNQQSVKLIIIQYLFHVPVTIFVSHVNHYVTRQNGYKHLCLALHDHTSAITTIINHITSNQQWHEIISCQHKAFNLTTIQSITRHYTPSIAIN